MPVEQSTPVGLIYPPTDVRGVIDKTAQFVAKCGPDFENRVLKEQNNTKFSFLMPNNPYRAYYDHKVKEFQTGEVKESKPEVPQAIMDQKAKEEEKRLKKQQKLMLKNQEDERPVKEPAEDVYTVKQPFITGLDQDIIKLTAQFVARNGEKFLIGLMQREQRNPQFDFLKPTHALFHYFTALVDAYTRCLMPSVEEKERLLNEIDDMTLILDRSMDRFLWDERVDKKRQAKEEAENVEREEMAQIDWHDFVPVETIEFTTEDDNLPLAPPIDVKTGAPSGEPNALDPEFVKEVRNETVVEDEAEEIEMDVGEEIQMDPEPVEDVEMEIDDDEDELPEPAVEEKEQEQVEEDTSIPLPEVGPIKIRHDYVRNANVQAQGEGSQMVKCPVTGQFIQADEMSTHLKKLLVDPQWVEQKNKVLEEARKETAFADDVEQNLQAFVSKRPDLFGTVEEQIIEAASAGAEAAAREAGADAGPAHSVYNPEASSAQTKTNMPPAPPVAAPPAAPGLVGGVPGVPVMPPAMSMHQVPALQTQEQSDSDDENVSKKARTDAPGAIPEVIFVSQNPGKLKYFVQVIGTAQTIPIEVEVTTMISDLKNLIAQKLPGRPVQKMKLKAQGGSSLQDAHSLAFYNITAGTVLELAQRERGGRKK